MLIRFSCQNFYSLRDGQELSLVASSLSGPEEGVLQSDSVPDGRMLPVAVIYGANASGKSSVIAGLRFMKSAISYSHNRGEPNAGVTRNKFALDRECDLAPSRFDIDFISNKVRYHYGFECSDEAFTREWLYAFPSGRKQNLFERENQKFAFGRNLKGRNRVIADLTRDNSLFVSAAMQNGHDEISDIFSFFSNLRIHSSISVSGGDAANTMKKSFPDQRSLDFLQKIGTGVVGYRKTEVEFDDDRKELVTKFNSIIESHFKSKDIRLGDLDFKEVNFELSHQSRDGDPVYLKLSDESAGTRRLLVLLNSVFKTLDEGAVIVIDELDASLHTQACEALVALFSCKETNPNEAQLIATTHDTNLLSSKLLRRDQIWFTEKDRYGATHVYPLTDIRTRETDNIEKGYLQGRFGAIPYAGSITDLFTGCN